MKGYRTVADIQHDLKTGNLSCLALVGHYLERIRAHKVLNAFIEVFEQEARDRAKHLDEKLASGTAGRLAGLMLGIKDVLCQKGHQLTASSRILSGFESQFTATAVQRLLDEDAIILGRLSCDEFAMGSSNENSCFGPVKNPHDLNCVPGGSSGASAAAVSAGLCHASLGSDTGGSVRQPASFCGTVGMKPTYGRVSRWGLVAYASSFDQIGPITQSVEDSALLMEIMAGPDGHDNTASSLEVPRYSSSLADDVPSLTIGYVQEALENEGLDPEIKAQSFQLLEQLQQAGHRVKPVAFPMLDYVVPCYYVLTTAEASSNLSRFDGVRYGYRSKQAEKLEEVYTASRTQGFGEEVKRRIMLGTFVLSAGYYDAYYTQAMKVRRLIQQQTQQLFEDCDLLFTPTAPSTAFQLGEKTQDPVEMFLADIFTVHANLAGVPAISLPLGTHSNGLPFGMQFMAPSFQEQRLFDLGHRLMARTQPAV